MTVEILTDSAAALPADLAAARRDRRRPDVAHDRRHLRARRRRAARRAARPRRRHDVGLESGRVRDRDQGTSAAHRRRGRRLHDRVDDEQHLRSRGRRRASRGRPGPGRRHQDGGRRAGARRARRRGSRATRAPISTGSSGRRASRWTKFGSSRPSRTSTTSCRAAACPTSRAGRDGGSGSHRSSSSATAARTRCAPRAGSDAARDRILSRWRRDRVPGARLHVAALHAEAEARRDLVARPGARRGSRARRRHSSRRSAR